MLPARVTQWKGHALLVEALARLERGSFHCLMVGEYGGRRSVRAALEPQIARLGLTPHIHFVGRCDDMPAAYKMADVVVRSEEHTSELQSLMRSSYAVFCLKKKNTTINTSQDTSHLHA